MPAWLWPKDRQQETSLAIRLGRVLHWGSLAIALLLLTVFWAYLRQRELELELAALQPSLSPQVQ